MRTLDRRGAGFDLPVSVRPVPTYGTRRDIDAIGAAGKSAAQMSPAHYAGHRFTVCSSRLIFVAITEDRFQPVQLPFDLIRAERDIRPLFVGDDQAVSLRYVDALNLQTTLKNLR